MIDSADDIRVEFTDGRSFKAKLVGADKPSDLALLKIEATESADRGARQLRRGAGGRRRARGRQPARHRPDGDDGHHQREGPFDGSGDGSYEDFLQTDAPINHGNSGGALVNLKGELVGINSQIVSQSDGNIGIGFAIPANMARHVMDDLRKDGRVRRAQLGVTIQPVTRTWPRASVSSRSAARSSARSTPDSAADRAGLKRGDVIKSFNGQPVQDFNSLRNRVADMAPGSSATVGIVRDGSEKTLTVKLDEAAASKSARERDGATGTDDKAALGVSVAPLTPELAAQAKLPRDARGVVVQDVNPDGRAADAGIQAGDIIHEVNRQPVQSVDELRAAVRKSPDRPTLLLVNRDGQDIFVTVRPRKSSSTSASAREARRAREALWAHGGSRTVVESGQLSQSFGSRRRLRPSSLPSCSRATVLHDSHRLTDCGDFLNDRRRSAGPCSTSTTGRAIACSMPPSALTPEQFTRDLGSSFKSVRDTLAHLYSAEWAWYQRWHGTSPTAHAAVRPVSRRRVAQAGMDRRTRRRCARSSTRSATRASTASSTTGCSTASQARRRSGRCCSTSSTTAATTAAR